MLSAQMDMAGVLRQRTEEFRKERLSYHRRIALLESENKVLRAELDALAPRRNKEANDA